MAKSSDIDPPLDAVYPLVDRRHGSSDFEDMLKTVVNT